MMKEFVLHSTVIAIRCNHRWLLSWILLVDDSIKSLAIMHVGLFFVLLKLFHEEESHKVINLCRMSMLIEHVILDCHYCHLQHITCAQQLYFDFLINPWGCSKENSSLPIITDFCSRHSGEWFIIYSWQLLCVLLHSAAGSRG